MTRSLMCADSLDGDHVEVSLAGAQLDRRLVFGRTITRQRRVIAWKFDDHAARALTAFHNLLPAAAHQIARAEHAEGRRSGVLVGLVAFGIGYIDMDDPVALQRGRRTRRVRPFRLRTVEALDDQEVAGRVRLAKRMRPRIVWTVVVGQRLVVGVELAQYVAPAHLA